MSSSKKDYSIDLTDIVNISGYVRKEYLVLTIPLGIMLAQNLRDQRKYSAAIYLYKNMLSQEQVLPTITERDDIMSNLSACEAELLFEETGSF